MPVDEFGREIPHGASGGRSGRSSPAPNYGRYHGGGGGRREYNSYRPRDNHYGGGPPAAEPRRNSSGSNAAGPAQQQPQQQRNIRHPSQLYQEEALLCEFLWKDKEKKENPDKNDEKKDDENDNADAKDDNNKLGQDTAENDDTIIIKSNDTLSLKYKEYRQSYCLRYIRAFFNHHLDDSWFRALISPLVKRQLALQERQRAHVEAFCFSEELSSTFFIEQALLDGGIKEDRNEVPKSHVLSISDRTLQIVDIPSHVTTEQLEQALMSHVSASTNSMTKTVQDGNSISVPLFDIYSTQPRPPLHSRNHHYNAYRHMDNNAPPRSSSGVAAAMDRQAMVVCATVEICTELLDKLTIDNTEHPPPGAGQAAAAADTNNQQQPKRGSVAVPRKGDEPEANAAPPSELILTVDASDPYGRLEYDANGKGGAPADGLAIPVRKARVRVLKFTLQDPVKVLSAALSTSARIPKDKTAAILLARALDVYRDIPASLRFDELLELPTLAAKNKDDDAADKDPSDDAAILDVCIAYLRRVHLFSFYNGCTRAPDLAAVLLSEKHGAIHLRLKQADSVLKETHVGTSVMPNSPPFKSEDDEPKEEVSENAENSEMADGDVGQGSKPATSPSKDMLVQRLDDGIRKALDECDSLVESGGSYVIDQETDQDAQAIAQAEQDVRQVWLDNHAMLDDDRRARCSFHFCHKLFKDKSFLHKHLIKKHGEFLKAEQAKCHDSYMMKAWDALEERSCVPPVLVDCGTRFGCQPAAILVGRTPDVTDPEPQLWAREEEKRAMQAQQRQRREESRHDNHHNRPSHRNSNFVDVDDMKDEKVEIKLDDMVPATGAAKNKKKKKKRKLL